MPYRSGELAWHSRATAGPNRFASARPPEIPSCRFPSVDEDAARSCIGCQRSLARTQTSWAEHGRAVVGDKPSSPTSPDPLPIRHVEYRSEITAVIWHRVFPGASPEQRYAHDVVALAYRKTGSPLRRIGLPARAARRFAHSPHPRSSSCGTKRKGPRRISEERQLRQPAPRSLTGRCHHLSGVP